MQDKIWKINKKQDNAGHKLKSRTMQDMQDVVVTMAKKYSEMGKMSIIS